MNKHAYDTCYLLSLNCTPMWAFFSGGTLLRVTESDQDAQECLARYKSYGGKVRTKLIGAVTAYLLQGQG